MRRERLWEVLEASAAGGRAGRVLGAFMVSLIVLNVLAVMLGTVEEIERRWRTGFEVFEVLSVVVFTAEYVLRLWVCVVDPRFAHPVRGRLRFAFQPMSLVDLASVLPFYLPFAGVDLRVLRALRLVRIVRVAKVGRYYASLRLIGTVFRAKKEELVLAVALMALLVVVAASVMYYCESAVQPTQFPSIPAALWWAAMTMTTVGYGDVYPVTTAGKVIAVAISVLGIGMFALPTGIIGAGFVEAVQRAHARVLRCPHCGREIHDGATAEVLTPSER
jgi:voltage-gated potassium channel